MPLKKKPTLKNQHTREPAAELLARLGAHRHVWKRSSMSRGLGKNMTNVYQCECGHEKERKATKREQERSERNWKNASLTHETFHRAQKIVQKHEETWGQRVSPGWNLIQAMERFAKRNPKDVQQVGIDDSHFASSDLFLIDHKVPREYMGTTVLYVPQCTGEKPISFFLYPRHCNALVKALKKIQRKHTKNRW